MNRALTWLNLAGVAILAVLCVWQWRINRSLHLVNADLVRDDVTTALTERAPSAVRP